MASLGACRSDTSRFATLWFPRLRLPRPPKVSSSDEAKLSEREQEDYQTHDYKCYDRIVVTGRSITRRETEVLLNDNSVALGSRQLELLLILIRAAKTVAGGWVDSSALSCVNVDPRTGRFQPISRLRDRLAPATKTRDASELVEYGGANGFRISAHPNFITYNRAALHKHTSQAVRAIAKELPMDPPLSDQL